MIQNVSKKEREKKALEHTNEMFTRYSQKINKSIDNTKIYSPDFHIESNGKTENISFELIDTVGAINLCDTTKKVTLLNFSSYKHPGGMFLAGSIAQEECLCYASYLFNVLSSKKLKSFYDWNNLAKNRALYLNRALYTPDILFNGVHLVDVLSCASPNKKAAQKYCNVSNEENYEILKDRIRFLLDVAVDNQVDTLVLGAYGTGVFGQNPKEVAEIFKAELETHYFPKVIFAIPDKTKLEIFKNIF